MNRLLLLLAIPASLVAQDQQTLAANASVSGVVKDAGTGKPLANFNVSTYVNATFSNNTLFQTSRTKQVNAVTDEQGRYRLGDLPPGRYVIDARGTDFGSNLSRHISVAGHDLNGIDFSVKVNGFISGRVIDENKEPVPGITVWLISREYYYGTLGYFFKGSARTDDRGQYTISRVIAGHPYLLMAEKWDRRLPARSDVPIDPKLRRRAAVRTFYPNSLSRDGASILTVQPGEHREGVNIEMRKAQNFCIDGVISGSGGPAAAIFGIAGVQPSDGMSSSGGMMAGSPGGTTGPDGKFRVCNLYPGTWRFTAWQTNGETGPNAAGGTRALLPIAIRDEDIGGLKVVLGPGTDLNGEVVQEGPAPPEGIATRVSLSVQPMLRSQLPGENLFSRSDIPGSFSFSGLAAGDYGLRATINAPGFYVKDITYGGNPAMNEAFHLGGSLQGTGVRITVARDAATLNATVKDKYGNPAADIRVLVLPREISSEATLQAVLVNGVTDQQGAYRSHSLAPGKYYVAATSESFDATPESIGRLWRARNHFQEVDLAPGGSAQVNLEPVKID